MSSIQAFDTPLPDVPPQARPFAEPSAETRRASMPPLNELAVEEFSGGDRAVEAEIFQHFIAITSRDIEQLHAAIGNADPMAARLTSHRIKGACRIIGAAMLGAVLERIELASTRADWTAIRSELDNMDFERNRLIRHMKERMDCR